MRNLLLVFVLMSPLAAEMCIAQDGAIEIICTDCRDPENYPDDFVNFAFNQIYGPNAWLSLDQADDMFITNLDLQRVYVDADFVFYGIGIKGFRLPLWPTKTLQFTLALPSGRLFTALRSIFLTPLPVPATGGDIAVNIDGDLATTSAADEGDEGDEGDEYDDYFDSDQDEWDEPDDNDYMGFTTIEDPDEFGNFEEPEWCEEC